MWDTMDTTVAGGGFMNETNQLNSPSSKKNQVQRAQNVMPVVIRQILDCPEEEFKLFGFQAQMLCIVGILREYDVQSTKATYQVEDHTGTIPCVWWLESEASNVPNLPSVKEGRYIRVYGSLRTHQGSKSLMVLRMFPVDDINEVTNHLLQVIQTRLEAEHSTSENASKVKYNNPGIELANSMVFMGDNGIHVASGFTPLQQKVYNILKGVTSERGLNISSVLANFPKAQQNDARAALQFLTNEGHAYSTIDDDHFKVTECM